MMGYLGLYYKGWLVAGFGHLASARRTWRKMAIYSELEVGMALTFGGRTHHCTITGLLQSAGSRGRTEAFQVVYQYSNFACIDGMIPGNQTSDVHLITVPFRCEIYVRHRSHTAGRERCRRIL
jgi:hypothetical protein